VIRRASVLAAFAAAWAVGIWFLSRSSVPSLHLRHVDTHALFTPHVLRRADRFSRGMRTLWALATLAKIVALAVFARWGVRWTRESAAGRMGTGMLLGMLGFALVWVAQLPFSVLEVWWERRYGISGASYYAATVQSWGLLGVTFVYLCFVLAVVMGFARLVGDNWWLPAAPCFVALTLLLAFVTPWALRGHPLGDPQLRADVGRLERIEHDEHVPVRVMSGIDEPNAFSTGIGPSRRVFLWEPIVEPPFTRREDDVVIAHELGHLEHDHILKDVGWYAVFAFPVAFLVSRLTRRRGGMAVPEAVPLALLVLVVLDLIALPLQNVISRRMEAEADWSALQATRDPSAAAALFRTFVPTTLSQPDPPTWDYLLLENHPTVAQRLAMVRAWRERQATSAAQSP
jgi:STE24 endopeptidase